MDVLDFNRRAWNQQVADGNRWTIPVGPADIADARQGRWGVLLTPTRAVPHSWFGDLSDCDLLGLASGGGQQAPIFAAAGARVTILDACPAQLARDQEVAAREGLSLTTLEGDMADLSRFPAESFDLVFNPCSTVFVPDVRQVWREAARVLRPGGALLTGVANPVIFMFTDALEDPELPLAPSHAVPYSDLESLTTEQIAAFKAEGRPLEFGHTITDLIGGQLDAGLMLTNLFEDSMGEDFERLSELTPCFIATRAVKGR